MHSINRQKGTVIVTTALVLLFLLGFMGIALDFGHLFVVKTELQTAADSCALSAAQELDGSIAGTPPGANLLIRATSAGRTAGNANRVNFQGVAAGIVDADITFSNTLGGTYSRDPALAATYRYARCSPARTDMNPWMLQALTAFTGDAIFSARQSVNALAVATRTSAQTTCMLPIGICDPSPGTFTVGQWLRGSLEPSGGVSGQFQWLDFTPPGGGAGELADALAAEGVCTLPGEGGIAGEAGVIGSAAFAYNTRFGIYQGKGAPPADGTPDLTGYAYYSATVPPGVSNKFSDFLAKRAANSPYQGDDKSGKGGTPPDNAGLTGVSPPGNINTSLATVGGNRRLVTMPVVTCPVPSGGATVPIVGKACILLLHPISPGSPSVNMWVEYRGAADDPASPCVTAGLPGGSGGPLVPGLVR